MDPILATIVGALAAVLSSSGLIAAITAAFSRLLGKRTGAVEVELIQSFGLAASQGGHVASQEFPEGSEQERRTATDGERDAINNIFVNFGRDKESAEAIADVVRRHSEAHTRLIIKYYAQGYQQALVTFIASLIFAVVGFGIVIWACIYLFRHPQQPEPAAISAATGLVTQAVGYLFFRRADKARTLMTQLIDKLREDRDQEVRFIAGIASIPAIETSSLRDAVKVAAVSSLLKVPYSISDLEALARHSSSQVERSAPVVNIDARPRNNGRRPKTANDTQADSGSDENLLGNQK